MQQDIGAHPELAVQGQHVAIRIGCHFGPVVLENKDIFGATVHTANRMTSQAKAGQIILAAETVDRCRRNGAPCRAAWTSTSRARPRRGDRALRSAVAAGRRDQHAAVHRDRCPQGASARACVRVALPRPRERRRRRPNEITMGRAEENDVVVKGTLISRLHAKIEVTRDKFLLVDQSTNGTLRAQRGRQRVVRSPRFRARCRARDASGSASCPKRTRPTRSASRSKTERRLRRVSDRGLLALAGAGSGNSANPAPSCTFSRVLLAATLAELLRHAPNSSRYLPMSSISSCHAAVVELEQLVAARRRRQVEAREVEVLLARQEADRRFLRAGAACATIDRSTPARAGCRRSPATGTCRPCPGGTS